MKIEFSNDENARNRVCHAKWLNGTSNRYHMSPPYYYCRFRSYRDLAEYLEMYKEDLEGNMLRLTFTERFSKDYGKKQYIERTRRINHLAMLKSKKGGYTLVIGCSSGIHPTKCSSDKSPYYCKY